MSEFEKSGFSEEEYTKMLIEHAPKVIRTEKECLQAERLLESYAVRKEATPAEVAITELFRILITDYRMREEKIAAMILSTRQIINGSLLELRRLAPIVVCLKDRELSLAQDN